MGAIEVREATVEDARGIATLHLAAWRAAYAEWMPADFLRELDLEAWVERRRGHLREPEPGRRFLVAELAGAEGLAGFTMSGPTRDEDLERPAETAEVYAVYVAPSCWRRGVGRLLWDRTVEHLRGDGYAAVGLWVLEANRAARRFYEAVGLRDDGGRKSREFGGVELGEVRYRMALRG